MRYFEEGSFPLLSLKWDTTNGCAISGEGILHLFLAVSGGDEIRQTSLFLDGKIIMI